MVPTLCVRCTATLSVSGGMPTRRFDGSTVRRLDVGTIKSCRPVYTCRRPHLAYDAALSRSKLEAIVSVRPGGVPFVGRPGRRPFGAQRQPASFCAAPVNPWCTACDE
jgi:hypothetical protein